MNRTTRLILWTFLAVVPGTTGLAAPAIKPKPVPEVEATTLHPMIREVVGKGSRLASDQERQVEVAFRTTLQRVKAVAEVKDLALPIELAKLDRIDVAKTYEKVFVRNELVIAGDVKGTVAQDSVILAAGDVRYSGLQNCLVIGKNVRFTTAKNCVIVAEEFIRGSTAGRGATKLDTVLIAGRWVRMTIAEQCVCQVLKPGSEPAPDEPPGTDAVPIRLTTATSVMFLNRNADVRATRFEECRWVEPKGSPTK